MLKGKTININNIELSGQDPLTPRTILFFADHKINIYKQGCRVVLDPQDKKNSFCITHEMVNSFQKFKTNKDDYLLNK